MCHVEQNVSFVEFHLFFRYVLKHLNSAWLIACDKHSLVEVHLAGKFSCYCNHCGIFQCKTKCPFFIPNLRGSVVVNFVKFDSRGDFDLLYITCFIFLYNLRTLQTCNLIFNCTYGGPMGQFY